MSDAPPVGKIRLLDAVVPTVEAASYRITSSLNVATLAGAALAAPPPQQMHVTVDAPRFALDPGEVAARHPEIPAKGAYGDRLPHLVLGRRTLPWERHGPNGVPWLALLVVRKGEAALVNGSLRTLLPAAVVAALEAAGPIAGDPAATVLRFTDAAVLRGLLPALADVPLLCHVRQVNLADSAMAGLDDDGWFAVVTANRLPLAVGGADTEYVAALVSLEGRADLWAAPSGQPASIVVLHAWSFTSAAAGGTIEYLMTHLDVATFGAAAAPADASDAQGTIALQHTGRDGEASTVRYRGPLRGISAAPLSTGASDISRRAATELGRLLGCADARFLRELVGWHRAAEALARASLVAGTVASVLPAPPTRSAVRAAAASAPATTAEIEAALSAALASWAAPKADLWQVPPGATARAAPPARRTSRGGRR